MHLSGWYRRWTEAVLMAEEPRQQNRDALNNEDKPPSLPPDGVRQGAMSRVASAALRRTGTIRRILAVVSWFFVLIPAALPYLYVHTFGVNVVFADAWDMVLVFRKFFSGRLAFADLYAQHVEHRMFFPRGAELLLGLLTKYNNVAEMYLIVSCFLVTAAMLFLAFRREIGLPLIFFVPVGLLIFSFRQYENMLFGFQISFAFTQTFGVLALYLLSSSNRDAFRVHAFVAALGSATVASFSTAQGLLVWPAGFLGLLLGSVATSAKEYFLTLLGSALFWQQEHALAAGLVLGCLALGGFLATYGRGVLREHPFFISLFFYSSLILLTITLGRAGMFGVWQAAISRYTTFSVLAVASVYAMLAKMVFARRSSV